MPAPSAVAQALKGGPGMDAAALAGAPAPASDSLNKTVLPGAAPAVPAAAPAAAGQSPTAYPGTPLTAPPEVLKLPLSTEESASYQQMINKGFSDYEARYHATNPPGRVFPEGTPDPWRESAGGAAAPAKADQTLEPVEVTANPATRLSLTPELIERVLKELSGTKHGAGLAALGEVDPLKLRPDEDAIKRLEKIQEMNAAGRAPESPVKDK